MLLSPALIFMVTLLVSIVNVVFKLLKLASRIAFNRITVILTFVGSVGVTVTYIFSQLTDESSTVTFAFNKLNNFAIDLSDWVAGNDYLQLVGYGLSLDVLLDGVVSTFVWVFCSLAGILITVCIYLFYAVLPLLVDLILSGLQKQQERIQNAISS